MEKKELAIVEPLIESSRALSIESAHDLNKAVENLSELNRWNDRVEEDRLKLTKPLNDALKEINGRYRPIREALEGVIKGLREKMSQYASKVEKARQEAEMKLSERVASGGLKMETAVRKLEGIEAMEKTVEGEGGKVTFVEVDKFEVVDFKLLPDEYKLVNESAIRLAKKEGVEVAGVRYWKEQSVRNKR